jgi:hypothetical protein
MTGIVTEDVIRKIAATRWIRGEWYERDAAEAIAMGAVNFIQSRDRRGVYLARFWITAAKTAPDGTLESGDSALLHYFVQADDDESLHDHPWDFRTTILRGGYWEHLPPLDWKAGSELGPDWRARRIARTAGETVAHAAADLHCVGAVLGTTWTLVRTGPRVREWGFHPTGKTWQPWYQYLGVQTKPTQKVA